MCTTIKQKIKEVKAFTQHDGVNMLNDKVSEEVQLHRYQICQSCEKLYKPTNTCKVCGCFMKVKTWMPNQSCPIGKWSKVES